THTPAQSRRKAPVRSRFVSSQIPAVYNCRTSGRIRFRLSHPYTGASLGAKPLCVADSCLPKFRQFITAVRRDVLVLGYRTHTLARVSAQGSCAWPTRVYPNSGRLITAVRRDVLVLGPLRHKTPKIPP